MTINASDVMVRAATLLQDPDHVRWPTTEHLLWINDGIRELITMKPSLGTQTVPMNMVEGTLQTLADDHIALIRVNRNIPPSPASTVQSRAVTTVDRTLLDQTVPGWHDSAVFPFTDQVSHVIDGFHDQDTFHVFPGNTGAGVIEVVVSTIPDDMDPPTADPEIRASYTDSAFDIDLDKIWLNALVNYVLFKAYTKDMVFQGNAQRAVAHKQMFDAALGIKTQTEAAANVNTTRAQSQTS